MKWKVYRDAGSGKAVVGEYESDDRKVINESILYLFDYIKATGDMSNTKTVAYIPLNKYIVERV